MKILIVSHYFWPEQFRINDLVTALKTRGHDVSVLTGMPNYPGGKLFEGYSWWQKRHDNMDGVPVYRTPMFLRREGRGWQLALNYLSFVLFGSLLAPWYFRKQEFDVIFVYEPSPFTVGIPAMLIRRLKKAPMLFWVQDLWPESLTAAGAVHAPSVLNMVGKMVHWIYRHCDRVLVQSEAFVEPAVAAGADRERILYFPNWAESFYQPLSAGDEDVEGVRLPEGFKVMFAGNMGEAQSLETIVAAASQLRDEQDIHWVMIGDGRRREWMQQEVKRLGIEAQVHFIGSFAAETMPLFFAHADALLATLRGDDVFAQTIPSKVQSYMACGRPLLAALNGEGARVIEDAGAGIAVAAENDHALAKAVLELYRMPEEQRRAMGDSGCKYYNRYFDRKMLVKKLEQWMVEVKEEGLCES